MIRSSSGTSDDPLLSVAQASSSTDTTEGNLSGKVLQAVLADDHTPYVPTVSNGQTAFTLPETPVSGSVVRMVINGVEYRSPYITVSGAVVTWTNVAFTLASTDVVEIYYQ